MLKKPVSSFEGNNSVGHLSTPITTSTATKVFLSNLPIYRKGLSPLIRGLEVGTAHGYFLLGPFAKLGPLRNSEISLIIGLLSSFGLILILSLGLLIYGLVTFEKSDKDDPSNLETSSGWNQFTGGFLIGSLGAAGFAFIVLSNF